MKFKPWWSMHGGAFRHEDCQALIDGAHASGFIPGTYSDGTHRPNVSVCFMGRDCCLPAAMWIEAFEKCAPMVAGIHGISVWPDKLETIQVSRWQPGDSYGHHVDHDVTGILPYERKLSLYVSLTEGGGLEVEKLGLVRCGTGDMLAFSSIVSHAAHQQIEGERYSVVAWIPGPAWR